MGVMTYLLQGVCFDEGADVLPGAVVLFPLCLNYLDSWGQGMGDDSARDVGTLICR